MEPNRERILEALSRVIDPELRKPVTELDMVRRVAIDGGSVEVTIALTVAGCPLRSSFEDQVRDVMREVPGHARKEITVEQRAVGWLTKLNPRLVAYSAGSVISAMLFALVFSGFRPIPVPAVEANETALIFPVVSGSDREYHSYNNLPQDADATPEEHYYQLPRVLDNSALVSFSHTVYRNPGNEAMSAMVEVDSDGRAQLIDVLNAPKDPYVIEQLWWSLRNRTFQPATVSGHPVPTRIIMFVEKVDVSG